MNPRLARAFHDLDGLRTTILTGPAAGDLLFVDLPTGALPMNEALAEEARRRGFDHVLTVDHLGRVTFGSPSSESTFRSATEDQSQDPAAGQATPRAVRSATRDPGASTRADREAAAAVDPADGLRATVGRIDRFLHRFGGRTFIHFTELGSLLVPGVPSSPAARRIFQSVGSLMRAGHGNASSRLVVTLGTDALEEGRSLLGGNGSGAILLDTAEIPLPDKDEIARFLERAKDRHRLIGAVPPTASVLVQRRYTLTRISEALRRAIQEGQTDLTSIIGGDRDESKLAAARRRLDAMVGMDGLKREILAIVDDLSALQDTLKRGQFADPPTTHMALLGRPGTGKTEVAGIIGETLHAAGLRRRDHVVEANHARIIGQYNSGEAIQNMRRLIDEAADGVLFIDEAYTLAENERGRQAIDLLVAEMDRRRGSLTVIMAGYPDRMQALFAANEGLRSRIPHIFRLPDYSPAELCEIFDRQMRSLGFPTDPAARDAAHAILRRESTRPHANGRDVRELGRKWVRRAMTSGDPHLRVDHVVDPRSPSREAAESLIAEFAGDFKGLPEVEGWMRNTLESVLEALGRGTLTRAPRLVFTGPPGTGKTETARRIGRFLHSCGALKDGRVIETSLQDFTSPYAGEAAERTSRHFRDAAECVLFIDEIYRFAEDQQGRAILHQIVAALTDPDHDNVAVVIAGYEERMSEVFRTNEGLKDRFSQTIRFSWPESATLAGIALDRLARLHGKKPESNDVQSIRSSLATLLASQRMMPGFAGARSALKLADEVNDRVSARRGGATILLSDIPSPPQGPPLSRIVAEYREEHPDAEALADILQQVVAALKVRELSRSGAGRAHGLCLLGTPGSGKSTFARWLMGRLSRRDGMAPAPIRECTVQSLQGVHLGEAQSNVRRAFEEARGGFLFIDEFHGIVGGRTGPTNLYSTEIAKEIVAQMTDPRNAGTTVILAGYPELMDQALRVDQGLPGRFDQRFVLPSPSDASLARTAYSILDREYGGTGGVSFETLRSMLESHFAGLREAEAGSFSGFRAARTLADRAATIAMIRSDGRPERFTIEIDDVLGAMDP